MNAFYSLLIGSFVLVLSGCNASSYTAGTNQFEDAPTGSILTGQSSRSGIRGNVSSPSATSGHASNDSD